MHDPIRDVQVAGLVARLAEAARRRWGGRYLATYVWGGHARGDAIETSDVDVGVFLASGEGGGSHAEMSAREHALADELARDVGGPPRLDLAVIPSTDLDGRDAVSFRHGALLADGEDLTPRTTLPGAAEWADLCDEAAVWWVARSRPGRAIAGLVPALDADDPWLGYVCRTADVGGREEPCTKEPLAIAGRIATALVARATGRFVGDRPQAIAAYDCDVGDEGAPFLRDLQHAIRTRWRYLVPADDAGRAELRALCERTLAFERRYFDLVRAAPSGPRTEAALRACAP